MEGRAKVTKEVLCEEARFILANVMAEARYGRQNRYDDIRRVCEGAVSIPFQEYIGFLEKSGYLRHDRGNESLEVTPEGETVVNGGNLAEFTERAVSHFKKLRQSRAMAVPGSAVPMGTQSGVLSSASQPVVRSEASGASPLPRKDPKPMTTSGGRPQAMAGGEIQLGADMDNRYEKLASIGSGGMGTVYRARQVALNRGSRSRRFAICSGSSRRTSATRSCAGSPTSCARGATSRIRTSCRSTTSTSGRSIRTSLPSSPRTARRAG
jgi:hypothetical protein